MNAKSLICAATVTMLASAALAVAPTQPSISGDYLEVRSCDVYTGPCFANGQMGLSGKEGILVWSVRRGAWDGVPLKGLSVIAVVHTDKTLGDLHYQPRSGNAVLVVDAKADAAQQKALTEFARSMAGPLIKKVVRVQKTDMQVSLGSRNPMGYSSVKAGNVVDVSTRRLGEQDVICGNERTFYPPLTTVEHAYPAFTRVAAFRGKGLNLDWVSRDERSAFLAQFAR